MKKLFIPILFMSLGRLAAQDISFDSLVSIVKQDARDSAWFEAIYELSTKKSEANEQKPGPAEAKLMLKVARELGDNWNEARAHEALSNYFEFRNQFDSAIYHDLEGSKIASMLKDTLLLTELCCSLSGLYYIQEEYTSATVSALQGLSLFEASGKGDPVCLYGHLASTYTLTGEFDSARFYYEKTRQLIESQKNPVVSQLASLYTNLGANYFFTGDYKTAIELYQKSLDLDTKHNRQDDLAIDLINIGEAYTYLGNFAKAEDYLQRGVSLARQLKNQYVASSALSMLTDLSERKKDPAKALAYYKAYVAVKDSVFSIEKAKQIADMKTLYETEKKERDILQLRQEKQEATAEIEKQRVRNLLLGGASILFLLVCGGLIFGYLQVKKAKTEVERKNILITDINKRLTASQDALMLSNKTKDKFFALVAHDLRGPVTSFSGIGKLLQFNLKKGRVEKVEELLNQIDSSAGTVNHLLDNLLKWALSQTGALRYQPLPIDIKQISADSVEIFLGNARSKDINLQLVAEEGLMAHADNNMLSTVFRNLIGNATKFTPSGGTIKIVAEQQDDKVHISITDTGPGLPDGVMENILRREPVASTSGTIGEKGTGIGLLLCQEFLRMHGSTLVVKSDFSGTTFSFTLSKIKIEAGEPHVEVST